jgi:hypothetical protein
VLGHLMTGNIQAAIADLKVAIGHYDADEA